MAANTISNRLDFSQAIGQKLMLTFSGTEPPAEILATIKNQPLGGFTLFRHTNVTNPAQVRALTASLQRAAQAAGQPPLLIAADQEGGTLLALSGTTPFPGNLALGATRSEDLARRTGHALGRELLAMGINVNYAPVCDVNSNPQNAVVGPRAFGEDPALVARLSAAMIEGLQAAGVAATAKHFPGHGDTTSDSHYGIPVLRHDEARLRQVELPPFVAAIHSGVKLVMTGHIALPNYDGGSQRPATLSANILGKLLRGSLGFTGVIISDALDMGAIRQGPGLVADAITASTAGCDLLLFGPDTQDQPMLYSALEQAARQEHLAASDLTRSAERILSLKEWCATASSPALEVVGCAEHQALANEIAARSITLVRDTARRLPLQPASEANLAVVVPQPQDLTPADTSSYEKPALAQALRVYHPRVDEFIIPINPTEAEVADLLARLNLYDLVIVGTINAVEHTGQAALVSALLKTETPTLTVALRMPYDLQAYPTAPTYLCTYSIQPPALAALASALWGQSPFTGQLPVLSPIV